MSADYTLLLSMSQGAHERVYILVHQDRLRMRYARNSLIRLNTFFGQSRHVAQSMEEDSRLNFPIEM